MPLFGSQHAPKMQMLGLHVPPELQLLLGGRGQLACVVCVQLPAASQQAPSGVHGLVGTQLPAGVQLRLGGTGQRPKVVTVQLPAKSQHAPVLGPQEVEATQV